MQLAQKLIAAYLVAAAAVVAVDFIFRHFYFRTVYIDPVLGWLMAFAVVAALVVRYRQKVDLDRRGPDDSTIREYMEVNIAVYAAIVLTLWFFSNWFANVGSGGRPLDSVLGVPLFVLVTGNTGRYLWRHAAERWVRASAEHHHHGLDLSPSRT